MAVFDAEAYLRAVGERWEPDDYEPGVLCNPVLAAAAAALVAVDALTLGRAQAIIGDYSPAPAPGADRSHSQARGQRRMLPRLRRASPVSGWCPATG